MNIPSIAHQLEYHRLQIAQEEWEGIRQWAREFVYAREAGLLDHCRQLLIGMKSLNLSLSPHSQAVVWRCRALLAQILQEYSDAQRAFQRALALFLASNDDFEASRVLNDLGTIHQARGEFDKAIDCYQQALARFVPCWAGTPEEAMMRNNLGTALTDAGDENRGIQELELAVALYRTLAMPQGAARVYLNLGRQLRRRGAMERALTVYQEALTLSHRFDDRHIQVDLFNGLGVVYRHLGALDQAMDYYRQSLAIAQQVGDLDGQAQALNNLGTIHQLQGRYPDANYCYQETLRIHEMLGDISGQARIWTNLGHVQRLTGASEETALRSHQRALALYRQAQDKLGEASTLVNVASSYRNLGDFAQAETLYQAALAIGKQEQNILIQDSALAALGTLRTSQQQWAEAETYLQQALALQQQRGDKLAQCETVYKLGLLAYNQGHYEQVLSILEPAWENAFANEFGRWLYNIAWLIGLAFQRQGKIGAYNYFGLAILLTLQYGNQQKYQTYVAELTSGLQQVVNAGGQESALACCEQLLHQLKDEAWCEWSAPAIAHFSQVCTKICEHADSGNAIN